MLTGFRCALGAEPVDATPEAAQRRLGGLGGIGEAVGVGAQSGAHDSFGVEGPPAVELLAQRGRGGDEQVADLAQRGDAGLHSAVSGDMASFLPRRERTYPCGWLISTTRQPRSSSDRVKAAPNDPVGSTPTAVIWPNDASHVWAER